MSDCATVAVVIVTYNFGQYLDDALRSVLEQSRRPDQIVVVDDGSTNETRRLVATVPERYPGVRSVLAAHRGQAFTRNTGMRATTTDYVLCLDGDDRLKVQALEKLCGVLDQRPEIDFAYCWSEKFGTERGIVRYTDWDPAVLVYASFVQPSAVVLRRSAFVKTAGWGELMQRHGGFDEWDLFTQAAEVGLRGQLVPEALVDWRRHDGSDMPRMMSLQDTLLPLLYQRHYWFFVTGLARIGELLVETRALEKFVRSHREPLDAEAQIAARRVNTARAAISQASQRVAETIQLQNQIAQLEVDIAQLRRLASHT